MKWKTVVPALLAAGLMTAGAVASADGSLSGETKPESQGTQGSLGTTELPDRSASLGQQQTVTMTVQSVDRANNKVTFEAELDPQASVQENGNPVSIEQLSPGDSVRASFDPYTGEVVQLEVIPSSESQPSAPQPETPELPEEPSTPEY